MKSYRLVLVLKSSLTDSERKKILDSLKDWLKNLKVGETSELGQKPLSYLIKKQSSGQFIELSIEGENIPSDFEQRLHSNEGVLRHLLLRN